MWRVTASVENWSANLAEQSRVEQLHQQICLNLMALALFLGCLLWLPFPLLWHNSWQAATQGRVVLAHGLRGHIRSWWGKHGESTRRMATSNIPQSGSREQTACGNWLQNTKSGLPLSRLHLMEDLQTSQTALPPRETVFKHMRL